MKKYKSISIILFFVFILACIFLSNSSYINKIFLKSKNSIDNPIINLYVENNKIFKEVNSETVFQDLKFKVTNFKDTLLNSAKIDYCIQIEDGLEKEYLEYSLINENTKEEIEIINKKTKEIKLSFREKEEVNYLLKINNNLPKDIEESSINIKVKLIAIQKK